jgi:hydrogenase maturation protease
LTDDEKREVAAVDPRVEELLARTEALAREQLMRLHGTMREMRPAE